MKNDMSNLIDFLTKRVAVPLDCLRLIKAIIKYYRYASGAERKALLHSDTIVCRNNATEQVVIIHVDK